MVKTVCEVAMKKDRLPPFTPTDNKLIDSDIYKKLTNASRVAYLLLCRQRKHHGQADVCCPYDYAEGYMERHTWSRAITELIERGLISKKQEGGLYRRKNIYKINTLGISIRGVDITTVTSGKARPTVLKSPLSTVCKSPLECDKEWNARHEGNFIDKGRGRER